MADEQGKGIMTRQFWIIGACILVGGLIALLRMDPLLGGAFAVVLIAFLIYIMIVTAEVHVGKEIVRDNLRRMQVANA